MSRCVSTSAGHPRAFFLFKDYMWLLVKCDQSPGVWSRWARSSQDGTYICMFQWSEKEPSAFSSLFLGVTVWYFGNEAHLHSCCVLDEGDGYHSHVIMLNMKPQYVISLCWCSRTIINTNQWCYSDAKPFQPVLLLFLEHYNECCPRIIMLPHETASQSEPGESCHSWVC